MVAFGILTRLNARMCKRGVGRCAGRPLPEFVARPLQGVDRGGAIAWQMSAMRIWVAGGVIYTHMCIYVYNYCQYYSEICLKCMMLYIVLAIPDSGSERQCGTGEAALHCPSQAALLLSQNESGPPKAHIDIRILRRMIPGIAHILGLGIGIQDPYADLIFWAPMGSRYRGPRFAGSAGKGEDAS